jgi:hypothetical protein
VDLADGVAVRLALLCRVERGTLLHTRLIDAAVRGALLCDLALAGRIADEPDGIEVDLTPTGFAPADAMLAGIDDRPGRTLDEWLADGPALREVADELLRSGRWVAERSGFSRSRRYVDPSGASRNTSVDSLAAVLLSDDPLDEVSAVEILLAHEAHLINRFEISKQFGATWRSIDASLCGAADWLLPPIIEHLEWLNSVLIARQIAGDPSFNTVI